MKPKTTWWVAVCLIGLLGLSLATPPAHASPEGRRNTAIVLGAASVYELLKGQTTKGVLLGAGAWYAYTRYKDAKDKQDQKQSNRSLSFNFAAVNSPAYQPAFISSNH